MKNTRPSSIFMPMQPSRRPPTVAAIVGVLTFAWLCRHAILPQDLGVIPGQISFTELKPAKNIAAEGYYMYHRLVASASPAPGLFFGNPLHHVRRANTSAPQEFEWYDLEPSENVTWVDCYDGHKCARLSLPLDYLTPKGPKTHIALQMIPATDLENYRGSILLNPGGPGLAGTALVKNMGAQIAQVVGPEFDILGFDPRGTGATTPLAQCFESEAQVAQWNVEGSNVLLNVSDNSVPFVRSRERLVGQRCLEILGGNGKEDLNGTAEEWGPARFMSSASVATDMLRIIEQLGQEKLQFWGFSYGLALGQYFAAMYPDRVGRVVIDGVFDAEEYAQGLWNDNIADAGTVVEAFYTFCHQGGPEKCPLYESSAEGVKQRVHRLFSTIESSPLPIPFLEPGPQLVTKTLLLGVFYESLSSPIESFPTVAAQFYAVETNNQTAIHEFFGVAVNSTESSPVESNPWQVPNQAQRAIAFSDSGLLKEQPGDAETLLARLYNDDPISAPFWAPLGFQGWEWKIEAKWRYPGPFAANTSHPILIAQPTHDPRCPIAHARRV